MFDSDVKRQAGVRAFGYSAVLAGMIVLCGARSSFAATDDSAFARQVDLESFRLIALQNDGRFKTFDTMAREVIREITGTTFFEKRVAGATLGVKQDPVFTFLDMAFNPREYQKLRVIYVKKKPIRDALVRAAAAQVDKKELNEILADGLVSMQFLAMPPVWAKLQELRSDVMRTAKEVDNLITAANLSTPRSLMETMRVIPPRGCTTVEARWNAMSTLSGALPKDALHGEMDDENEPAVGLDATTKASLNEMWTNAGKAWREKDAAVVSVALNALAAEFPKLAPAVYPLHQKLAMEHWYYKYDKMTWTWWFYMLAVVFLLMGIVYRWPRARGVGIGVFALAFSLHTVASGIRWYLAGRIPNSNMFEAVTAAAWFGVVVAIFFELGPAFLRASRAWRTAGVIAVVGFVTFALSLAIRGVPFHNWQQWGPVPTAGLITFAAATMALISMSAAKKFSAASLPLMGSAVVSMAALMCGNFMTIKLDSDISNRMPVLNDVWLYIHTNMIIASYALIGIAYVTAAMYLVGRLLTKPTAALWWSMVIPSGVIALIGAIPGIGLMMVMPALIPFLLVIAFSLICYVIRFVSGSGIASRSFSVWEGLPLGVSGMVNVGSRRIPMGAEAVVVAKADGTQQGLAKVLDGATMLLLELFFITLWTGIIMGAVWADHSWGRPWGWDPKEVFALNTWIIFLIMVHVRIKVQDKALWTAVLAVIGCSVMLFNWIVVNFFITGLHSYA